MCFFAKKLDIEQVPKLLTHGISIIQRLVRNISTKPRIVAILFFIALVLIGMNSRARYHELSIITEFMYNYQFVDRITVSHHSIDIDFTPNNNYFDMDKDKLYPFSAGRVGVPARTRRSLQRQSEGQVVEIVYSIGNDVLFTVGIYKFAGNPFGENESLNNNLFTIGSYFGLALINNSNFIGSFKFVNCKRQSAECAC